MTHTLGYRGSPVERHERATHSTPPWLDPFYGSIVSVPSEAGMVRVLVVYFAVSHIVDENPIENVGDLDTARLAGMCRVDRSSVSLVATGVLERGGHFRREYNRSSPPSG